MTTAVRLALLFLALLILAGLGAWYYLFGPNKVDAAELVPGDTAAFVMVPNAARIAADYQTSRLKELVDSPDAKPILDALTSLAGEKNLDLLRDFLPNLSGQSFVAFTSLDPAHPLHGEIIGLRPKAGTGDFDAFVAKLKAAYPDSAAEVNTGTGQVEGLDYQWMQGAGIPGADKICTARYRGWIVIAWGEDALRDWWERMQKKAASPSLAQNPDYQKSLGRVGKDFAALVYFGHVRPGIGPCAVGVGFEQGEIANRFSLLAPRADQAAWGLSATPCPFETLKFTGPDTRFYWGGNFNWTQVWKNLQAQAGESPPSHPVLASLTSRFQDWAQAHNIDVQHNILDALGDEVSVQVEWSDDSSYPDAGLFLKLDHPDAFKPVTAAIIDSVRQAYETRAVVNEINAGSQNFATLKFVQAIPMSPTITEDGPYLGIFLSETHAVRSFQRDETMGLLKNADFVRQLGDKRAGASQIVYLDSPRLLDRAYRTALPYLSLAAMFDRNLAGMLQNRNLPPDLHWIAPMGTWTATLSCDDEGLTGTSISGIGNQGLWLIGAAHTALRIFPALGAPLARLTAPPAPPPAPPSSPVPPGNAASIPPGSAAPADAPTNAAPANPMTNAAPVSDQVPPPGNGSAAPASSGAAPPGALPPSTNATPSAPEPAKSE